MGIEPTTYSLGSCRSTTELRPQRLISLANFDFLGRHRTSDSPTLSAT